MLILCSMTTAMVTTVPARVTVVNIGDVAVNAYLPSWRTMATSMMMSVMSMTMGMVIKMDDDCDGDLAEHETEFQK